MMRHPKSLALGFAIALAAGALWWATRPQPVQVVVAQIGQGDVGETVSNTRAGTIRSCRRTYLAPGIGGQIARLDVKEGDRVTRGQVLLELWNRDLTAEVTLAKAQYDAEVAKARSACLQAEVAQREARRLTSLGSQGAVSADELDKVQSQASSKRAECESANAGILVAEARIRVAEAARERTVLIAPFDGVVAEVNGELYEYVTPSPPGIPTLPVVDLIDDGCFYVSAPIDEVDAARVRVGQPARVALDAFPGRRLAGQVRRVAPYVLDREKQSRTVEVEVELDDPAVRSELLAGYSADVEIVLEERKGVLRVPTEGVVEKQRVYVLTAAGRLEQRRIKPGLSNWDHTEVLEGLAAGDEVVTSVDREGVRDGAAAVKEAKGGE